MNAPNEGREEKTVEELMSENARLKQAYKYIHASRNSVDEELNEAQKENASLRHQLSERQQQLDATLRNTTRLLDQLSKERETNSNSYWRSQFSFLQKDYDEQSKQLEKEREVRKELVKELSLVVSLQDFLSATYVIEIEKLIAKASELDKT